MISLNRQWDGVGWPGEDGGGGGGGGGGSGDSDDSSSTRGAGGDGLAVVVTAVGSQRWAVVARGVACTDRCCSVNEYQDSAKPHATHAVLAERTPKPVAVAACQCL